MTAIEAITPRSRASWLKLREADVTASAIGALLGCHEYLTPFKLWALKAGRIAEDPEESEAMKRGRLLEPVAVELLRQRHPDWTITHNTNPGTYYRDPVARIGATPDVIVDHPERGRGVVQIKNVERSVFRRKWLGDNEEPEPPLWIALQAIVEAHLTGAEWAAVAPLVIGFGVEMAEIDVPLLPGVVERLKREAADFWRMIESGEEPTPDYSLDGDTITAIYAADEGEEVDLSGDACVRDLIETVHRLRAEEKAAAKLREAAEAEIRNRMRGATIGHLPGGRKITWRQQHRQARFQEATTIRPLKLPPPDQ